MSTKIAGSARGCGSWPRPWRVLANGVDRLLRRGLDTSYVSRDEELAGIRGRVNISITARRMLLTQGRAHCTFDELRVDTLSNQILRATVRHLSRIDGLDRELAHRLSKTYRRLAGITDVPLNRSCFRRVQLHAGNRFYRFLLNVCELVVEASIANEEGTGYQFRDFVRDEKKMVLVFESFVRNFLRKNHPDLVAGGEYIDWDMTSPTDGQLSFIPKMRTDVSVRDRPHKHSV